MTVYHYEHFLNRTRQIEPEFRFTAKWQNDPRAWQRQWGEKLEQLLGVWPPSCDPDPQWVDLEDRPDYALRRVTYFTEPGLRTFALVAIPHDTDVRRPGVLCIHGHGPLGAYPVMR